jgi:hypothetical protein
MSDGGFGRVLDESLTTRCRDEDPVVCAFFRSPRSGERPRRAVSTERWVSAKINEGADLQEVQEIAKMVSEELVTSPVGFMRDILLREPKFLPELPKWTDGEELQSGAGRLRFGVLDGNVGHATGNTVSDLKRAYVRLLSMNSRDPFDPEDVVRVICSPHVVAMFEMAQQDVPFKFDVLELPNLQLFDPWFLIRRPVAVIRMEKPESCPPSVEGSFLRLGVRYTIWLDSPASVVCNLRPEMVSAKG